MKLMFDGQEFSGPRGPAGPDGTPVGTVISFMGTSAPADYLICDGSEYGIAEYPALADFFKEQFGSANHFGGDGTATFAVPDMRNLFLRGYHGDAAESLSGYIGEKQDSTRHPYVYMTPNLAMAIPADMTNFSPTQTDTVAPSGSPRKASSASTQGTDNYTATAWYTSRPVNMAVLYCIKAVETSGGSSDASEEVYFTEETRIGTWIDGKPIYRSLFLTTIPSVRNWTAIGDVIPVDTYVNGYGTIIFPDNTRGGLGNSGCHIGFNANLQPAIWVDQTSSANWGGSPAIVILEYTKTTD